MPLNTGHLWIVGGFFDELQMRSRRLNMFLLVFAQPMLIVEPLLHEIDALPFKFALVEVKPLWPTVFYVPHTRTLLVATSARTRDYLVAFDN